MLKQYIWRGSTWQFEAGRQPEDAVEVTAAVSGRTAEKAVKKPANKKATAKNKAG